MFKDIDKNIIYYGVYGTDSENFDENDILCNVRKKFFETGVSQKGRGNVKTADGLNNVRTSPVWLNRPGSVIKSELSRDGSAGGYWSSTVYGYNYAYLLSFGPNSIEPTGNILRSRGYPVRCLVK